MKRYSIAMLCFGVVALPVLTYWNYKMDRLLSELRATEKSAAPDIPLTPAPVVAPPVTVPAAPVQPAPVAVAEPVKPEPKPPVPVIGIAPRCYSSNSLGLKPWYDNGTGKLHPELQFSFTRGCLPGRWDIAQRHFGWISR
jgi:hypothetical protein